MMIHQNFRFWINLLNELNIISKCLKKVLKSLLSFTLHKILHFFYKKIPQIHIICRQFLQNIAKVTHSFQSLDYMSGSLVENPEGSYRKKLAQSFCYEQNSTISINSSGMLRQGSPPNLHILAKLHLKRIVLISRNETWQTVLAWCP